VAAIAVALNARGQAGCKDFAKLFYWSKFGKRSDRLGCKTSVRLTATLAAAGDCSKTSPEIVASEYHLLNPVDAKSTDSTSGRDRYSRLPEPSVPPKRLSFTSYCRLLPQNP
jgi:hypothetical protein